MLRPLALALAILLAHASLARAQETVDLRPEEARALAMQAILAGDAPLAWEVSTALLRRDPQDAEAQRILAAAALQLGQPATARRAAAEAWQLAESAERRYEAARLAALAAYREDRLGLARWWLRLALLSAPSAEEDARTRQDAARLGQASPWRWDASLSFGPSENVNGGSETPYNVIEGLPFVGVISVDGRALSGWTGVLDLSVRRRLAESPTRRREAGLRLWARGVALSDESKALIEAEQRPGDERLTGADFSSALAEAFLRQDRLAGRWLLGAEVGAGLTWHGGELAYKSLRLGAEATRPLSERQAVAFDVFADRRWDPGGAPLSDRVGASVEWSLRLEDVGRLALSVGRGATFSDNRNAVSDYWAVQGRFTPAEPVGPARLDFRIGAQVTNYPDYTVLFPVPGGRQDERRFASLEATFTQWDIGGFAPVMTVEAARTESNVSRFDADGVMLGFGLRSTF